MFIFNVGAIIKMFDKKFTIKSRCWKEDINGKRVTYQCEDEIGDIHKFSETFIEQNTDREKGL